ncbi:hypothetical protein D3C86_1531740 [compost metagenome]
MLEQCLGNQFIVLGGLEHPLLLVGHGQYHRGGTHRGQQWHAGFSDELDQAYGIGRAARADDCIDVVFADQLFQGLDRGGGVAGVIQVDVGDGLVAGLGRQQRHTVLLRHADQGDGAGR